MDIGDTIFRLGFGRSNEEVLPDFFGQDLAPEQLRRLSAEKEQCYRDLVQQEGIRTVPGVVEWLVRFRQVGVRQALATSGCRANADLIAGLTGAGTHLDVVVTAEDVAHGKPEPDLFLRAAELLRVPPVHCLVVEDSLHGIEAARRAGMRCLGLATTHPADALHGCDRVLADMQAFSWAIWTELMGRPEDRGPGGPGPGGRSHLTFET
jgi:HAD superfamily hydrolase (TIGR01509 family)